MGFGGCCQAQRPDRSPFLFENGGTRVQDEKQQKGKTRNSKRERQEKYKGREGEFIVPGRAEDSGKTTKTRGKFSDGKGLGENTKDLRVLLGRGRSSRHTVTYLPTLKMKLVREFQHPGTRAKDQFRFRKNQ